MTRNEVSRVRFQIVDEIKKKGIDVKLIYLAIEIKYTLSMSLPAAGTTSLPTESPNLRHL